MATHTLLHFMCFLTPDRTLASQSVKEERSEWDIIVCVCRELHYEMMVE